MAIGDWSFPRSGCSCIRFKTQVAKRPWIGCLLSPVNVPSYGTDTTPRRYFLSVRQEWSATPIFAARTFTADWNITKENYGKIASTGGNPNASVGYFYPYGQNTGNRITAPEDLFPHIRANGTGNYVFTRDFINDANHVLQVAFTPAASTSIELTETFLIGWGPLIGFPPFRENAPATLKRVWSNEFTPAKMDARLREDLELERPYNSAAVDVPYPNNLVDNSVIPNIAENRRPWERGGVTNYEDYNFAVTAYNHGNVPDSAWDIYGHAHSWQSRLISQGAFSDSYGLSIFPATLSRCKIYQPGSHRFESKSLLDGSTTAFCQNLPVACPPDSANGDALYILEPPEKDLEKKELYLNSRCP